MAKREKKEKRTRRSKKARREVLTYYNYKETTVSAKAVISIVYGVLSLFLLSALTPLTVSGMMQNTYLIGALGITAFVMAFIGMLEGMASFKDDCKTYVPGRIGTILCAVLVAGWFLILCWGVS